MPGRPSSSRIGLLALSLLIVAFLADAAWFSRQLPLRVATHFDLQGHANGWMTRGNYRKFTIIVGIAMPLLALGIFALVRRLRGWGLNIPHKAYWLEPERQRSTFDFLDRMGLWFAALLVAFHAGLFHLILAANLPKPPALDASQLQWLTGGFLAALAVWVVALLVRFRRPSP